MADFRSRMNTDIAAGLLFAALGTGFCAQSVLGLKLGTAFRMGPGFFPAVVGGLLLVLGLIIALKGWQSARQDDWGRVPWRAILLIPTALLLFGLAMRPLGLAPALLILSFLAGFATGQMSMPRVAMLALGTTAVCVGIFSFGLGVSLPLIGNWLR